MEERVYKENPGSNNDCCQSFSLYDKKMKLTNKHEILGNNMREKMGK